MIDAGEVLKAKWFTPTNLGGAVPNLGMYEDRNGDIAFARAAVRAGGYPTGEYSPAPGCVHTGNVAVKASTDGTDATPVVTETYIAEIQIPTLMRTSGIALFNGSAVAGNVKCAIFNSAGTMLGSTEVTSQANIDRFQRVALTSSLTLPAGTYYVGVQYSSASARFNAHPIGNFGASKKTGETFGNFTTITPPTTFTAGVGPMGSLYSAADIVIDFPLDEPTLVYDFEWSYSTTGRFFSDLLGEITAAQAVAVVRASALDLAEDENGLLVASAANTPRRTQGRGLWSDTTSTCRVDFNGDLTNVAWTCTNCTPAKDLPSPWADGSVPGCSITVTADGDATCLQTLPAFSGATECLPSGRFYLPSLASLGVGTTVEITQDGVVWTDVTALMPVARWKRLPGVSQAVTLDPQVLGVRVKNAKAGNKIGWMLGNTSRGYVMSGDIYTSGSATKNRNSDVITVLTENFSALEGLSEFTIVTVAVPVKIPLPAQDDFEDHPRNGWTVWEMNNPYDIQATSTEASIEPYGGAGEGSLITIGGVVTGNWLADLPGNGLRLTAGTGAGARQDITEQVSGTPGGAGTYRCMSDVYPDGQTTGVIELSGRRRTAQGLALNAAQKPDDPDRPGISRVGMTVTAEPDMQDFGNDPQHEDVQENGVNAEVVTFDLDAKEFTIVLNGDPELSNPAQFTERPVFNADYVINLGSQYPSGGPLNGHQYRHALIGRRLTDDEAIDLSLAMQAKYQAMLNL